MAVNEKIQNEYRNVYEPNKVKRKKLANVNFDRIEPFNMRVRSWLRMNAGGVLNTCKSSEAIIRKFSDGRMIDLAADGWVTRG